MTFDGQPAILYELRTHSRQLGFGRLLGPLVWLLVAAWVVWPGLAWVHLSNPGPEVPLSGVCAEHVGDDVGPHSGGGVEECGQGHSPHHDGDACATCRDLLLAKLMAQRFVVLLVELGAAPVLGPEARPVVVLEGSPVVSHGPPRGPPLA